MIGGNETFKVQIIETTKTIIQIGELKANRERLTSI